MPSPSLLETFAAHPATAAWTPALLTSITAGWDFSDTSKITSSSNLVSDVAPTVGSAHLVQATGTKQPTTNVNTLNGKNVLKFDGTSDYMTASFTALTQPTTLLFVLNITTVASIDVVHDSNDGSHRHQTWTGSSAWNMFAGSVVSPGSASTGAQQVVVVYNGASSALYVGGTQVGSAVNPGSATMGGLTLGSTNGTGSNFYSGDMGEFYIMNAAISGAERTSWNTYCARWGL